MRTNSLKRAVRQILADEDLNKKVIAIYHRRADKDDVFPHVIYHIEQIGETERFRHDYQIIIDVYVKSKSTVDTDDIADMIEDMFTERNDPKTDILPTFFVEQRRYLRDENPEIQHVQITITAQVYEVEVNGYH